MPSSATLSTLRDRVEALLYDSTNITWTTGTIDEGVKLALEEYSRAKPLQAIGTVTPTAATREVSVSSLTGLIEVLRVWFPYTASNPEYPPKYTDWTVLQNGGTPTLFLHVNTAPNGTDVARVFYTKLHTLDGLAGASATTFSAADDGMLVIGAAGYAMLSRATDAVETQPAVQFGTRNYESLARQLLAEFRRLIHQSERGVRYGV